MQVSPNQLVELHLDSSGSPQMYKSRVEDVYDDLVVIAAPIHKGALVPIRVGTRLHIEFKISTTVLEGRFRNEAIVEKRFSTNNLPLLQLRLLGDWVKTQDRSFVRVPVFIDTVFVPILEEHEKSEEELPAQTGVILNLSGGGFLLRTSYPLKLENQVKVSFYVEQKQIVAEAEVARLVPTEEGQDYGFRFLDLPEQVRSNIIRFVFKRQIELAEMTKEQRT
ncbi:MAG: flagellar brake protein [Firmicutes bacterium]|nr:flagellar brake protein [Bacillota bacterium]